MKELTKLKVKCIISGFLGLTFCFIASLTALFGGGFLSIPICLLGSTSCIYSITRARQIDNIETATLLEELGVDKDPLLLEAETEIDEYLDGLGSNDNAFHIKELS